MERILSNEDLAEMYDNNNGKCALCGTLLNPYRSFPNIIVIDETEDEFSLVCDRCNNQYEGDMGLEDFRKLKTDEDDGDWYQFSIDCGRRYEDGRYKFYFERPDNPESFMAYRD